MDPKATVTVRDDGSLKVTGPVDVVDGAGARWPLAADEAVFLCRCGQSARKPFCDGSHRAAGFSSRPRAEEPGA